MNRLIAKCGVPIAGEGDYAALSCLLAAHEATCPHCEIERLRGRQCALVALLRREQRLRDPAWNDGFNRHPGSRHHHGWQLARDIDKELGHTP